jgi:hypothetical protein
MVMCTIFIVIYFKYLMCLHINTNLSPTLEYTISVARQVQYSKGNKLHGMKRASYILNAKMICFRPHSHGTNINSVRFL